MELGALAVYVTTFIDELSRLGASVVSMVSTVVPDNLNERTFKIERMQADGRASGLDLKTRRGGSLNTSGSRRRRSSRSGAGWLEMGLDLVPNRIVSLVSRGDVDHQALAVLSRDNIGAGREVRDLRTRKASGPHINSDPLTAKRACCRTLCERRQ